MDAKELREKYQQFFESKNHKRIASASLIPENDASVLFTTAGMHPLVPYLLGQKHPLGNRITDVQRCIRTGDIDEVGDDTHLTFFEMLGNWSMGDYFKEEAIKMSYEFLTNILGIPHEKLSFTCFAGDDDAPKDEEAASIWKSLGVSEKRIAFLPKKDNWWGPAGQTGPCGPDSEMFYWNSDEKAPEAFDPEDDRWVEIWNDVFMQYDKQEDGSFVPLKQQNVDTGLGVERVAMILEGGKTVYDVSTIKPIYDLVSSLATSTVLPPDEKEYSIRVITDHMRSATFILGDERDVVPSNVDQGYILRRFIRRSIRHLYLLKATEDIPLHLENIASKVIDIFGGTYTNLFEKKEFIFSELKKESEKFISTLERGLSLVEKEMTRRMFGEVTLAEKNKDTIEKAKQEWFPKKKSVELTGKWLFDLFQSQGMPPEMTLEEVKNSYNATISNEKEALEEFAKEFEHHQELSRVGAEKKFKGGLADDSIATTRLHTATHLLNEALRKVISPDIKQKGSNITAERLRFDFNFDRKLTDEEVKAVEDMVNQQIKANIEISKEMMKLDDALKSGAQSEFGIRYPQEVSVYTMGAFSKEICMGPHVQNTSELGKFKIVKEQSSAAGIRRIKAVLEDN
ncbi:MAG: alanine--tRNA ligase [Nanoarchaeota archaeon]|nr:alanine--tRNA ligase [Nanoarchaeota archaeon]